MYDMDFARRLRQMSRPRLAPAWYEAVCTVRDPLTFTLEDGQLQFKDGENLRMAATAAGVDWQPGYRAVGLLSSGRLLLLDRI